MSGYVFERYIGDMDEVKRKVEIENQYHEAHKGRNGWVCLDQDQQKELADLMGGPLTNSMKGRLEVMQVVEELPDKLVLYVSKGLRNSNGKRIYAWGLPYVLAWTGDEIGVIIEYSDLHESRGGKRYHFYAIIGNQLYSGYYYPNAGDYCTLSKSKTVPVRLKHWFQP